MELKKNGDKILGLCEPYLTTPWDLKSVLRLKSYLIENGFLGPKYAPNWSL